MGDIRGTLMSITRNVSKSSGELIKTTKLSVNLASEQEALKNLYTEIGKKVHEIYLYGGTLGKFFDEKYHELEACESRINALKEQINQIKGTRECLKCGKTVEKSSEFCPKCGMRLDGSNRTPAGPNPPTPMEANPMTQEGMQPPSVTPPSMAAPAASEAKRKCNVCGALNDTDTKFCLTCGRIL